MGQVRHGSATTTHAVRAAIQRSQASLATLSRDLGINPKTVAKWRKRQTVDDLKTGPKEPRSTVLTAAEEAAIVAFRRHTLLPLDDCLYALQPSIPHLTRSALHRCLQRHGISRLPDVEGDKPKRSKFKRYRTLPMVWYIPPLSPIQNAAQAGQIAMSDQMPDVRSLRIPVKYLANMLTAGDEEPIVHALERMSAMRLYMRALSVEGVRDEAIAARVGMSGRVIEDMYKIMAIADYEDRFAIPTTHREQNEHGADIRGGCGFTDGNGCSTGEVGKTTLFGGKKKKFALPQETF